MSHHMEYDLATIIGLQGSVNYGQNRKTPETEQEAQLCPLTYLLELVNSQDAPTVHRPTGKNVAMLL